MSIKGVGWYPMCFSDSLRLNSAIATSEFNFWDSGLIAFSYIYGLKTLNEVCLTTLFRFRNSSWVLIRLMCLDSVKTVKYQKFSELRFRGNYSSHAHECRCSASTFYILFSRFFLMLFISWSVSSSCWKGSSQNRLRFSELTFKCWYCSIFSPRSSQTTIHPVHGQWYKWNELRYFFWFHFVRKSGLLMSGIHFNIPALSLR